jgi:hypothetical protein
MKNLEKCEVRWGGATVGPRLANVSFSCVFVAKIPVVDLILLAVCHGVSNTLIKRIKQ